MHAQYFIDNFRTKCAQYAFFYKIQHCQSVGNIFFLNVAYDSWLCIFSNDFWWHPFIFTPTCLNFDLKLPYFPRFLIKFPISWTMSTWTLLLLVSTSETYSDGRCLHGGRGFFLLGEGGGSFLGVGWGFLRLSFISKNRQYSLVHFDATPGPTWKTQKGACSLRPAASVHNGPFLGFSSGVW